MTRIILDIILCAAALDSPHAKCRQRLSIQYTPFSSNFKQLGAVGNPSFIWKAWPHTGMATVPAADVSLSKFLNLYQVVVIIVEEVQD